MKTCPTCKLSYPSNALFCTVDGARLEESAVLAVGSIVRGKYRILEKVGQGGMGEVYKAMHIGFDEPRALKMMSSEMMKDPLFVERFKHEAFMSRKLQHPNVVRVDDIDEAEDGRPFIVMEFIEGQSLKKVIETQGPLPVPRVCAIVKQVAAALDAAHRMGMIHRDIKPDNIALIPAHGTAPSSDTQTAPAEIAKVLDFGIAKLTEARAGKLPGLTLTGTGVVIGTAQYMSPEQAMGKRGDELDGRSDLYSLGVVAYQMLTGALPFKATSTMEMVLAHMHKPPTPITSIRPELSIPDPIAALVMRCLEKDRANRPASAGALAEEIKSWEKKTATVRESAVVSPPATKKPELAPEVGQLQHVPEAAPQLPEQLQEQKALPHEEKPARETPPSAPLGRTPSPQAPLASHASDIVGPASPPPPAEKRVPSAAVPPPSAPPPPVEKKVPSAAVPPPSAPPPPVKKKVPSAAVPRPSAPSPPVGKSVSSAAVPPPAEKAQRPTGTVGVTTPMAAPRPKVPPPPPSPPHPKPAVEPVPASAPPSPVEMKVPAKVPAVVAPKPTASKVPLAVGVIIVVLLATALVAWRFIHQPAAPSVRPATNTQLTLRTTAQELESQHELEQALENWNDLARQPSPLQDDAKSAVARVQGQIDQAQSVLKAAQDAANSKKYDEAEANYKRAEEIDTGLKTQADNGIQNVEDLKKGLSQGQAEQNAFNRGLEMLRARNFKGAQAVFKSVVDRNLPGSQLVPKAHEELAKLDALVRDEQKYDSAVALFKAGRYDAATPAFNDLISQNSQWKHEAQDYLAKIDKARTTAMATKAQEAAQSAKKQALAANIQQFNSLKAGRKYDEARALLNAIGQQGGDAEGLKADLASTASAEFRELQAKRSDANQRKDTQTLSSLKGSFEDLARRDSGDPQWASRARDVAENQIPADLEALTPSPKAAAPPPRPPAAASSVSSAVVSLMSAGHTTLSSPFDPNKAYSQNFLDEGFALQSKPDLSNVNAPSGTKVMMSLEVDPDGLVAKMARCISGGTALCQAIASAPGWKFSGPTVNKHRAKAIVGVTLQF